jgi:hypothetical protein
MFSHPDHNNQVFTSYPQLKGPERANRINEKTLTANQLTFRVSLSLPSLSALTGSGMKACDSAASRMSA